MPPIVEKPVNHPRARSKGACQMEQLPAKPVLLIAAGVTVRVRPQQFEDHLGGRAILEGQVYR